MLLLMIPAFLASQDVPPTYWDPPVEGIDFTVDSSDGSPYLNLTHTLSTTDLRDIIDRACVVWGRTADVDRRCQSTKIANVAEDPDHDDNDVDEFHFEQSGSGSPAGVAWCHFHVTPLADSCDFWLTQTGNVWQTYLANAAADQCAAGPGNCTTGIAMSPGPLLDGGVSVGNFLQTVAMHEIGHTLGLYHPSCDGTSYNCPIMTQRENRVTYWPSLDDTSAIRARYGTTARQIQFALYDINSSSTLTRTVGWSSAGFSNVASRVPPRIACKADGASGTTSCVLSTNAWTNSLSVLETKFTFLNISSTGVSVSSSIIVPSSSFAEGPVDVAFSNANQWAGIGKTPVFRGTSDATRVMIYSGTVGAAPTVTRLMTFSGTHTEPRISFNESRAVYMAAWPKKNGQVRVMTLGLTGNVISAKNIDKFTTLPVEVSCDAHLIGTLTACSVYVQDIAQDGTNGSYLVFSVGVNADGTIVDGDSDDFVDSTPVLGFGRLALLDDVVTYGNGAVSPQPTSNRYLLSGDAFRSKTLSPVNWTLYSNANTTSFLSERQESSVGFQTNVTAVDWNEFAGRFVAIRLGSEL